MQLRSGSLKKLPKVLRAYVSFPLQPAHAKRERCVVVGWFDDPAPSTPVVDRQAEQGLYGAAIDRAPAQEVQGII